ncbi:MAG TPA: hypothetical protein VGE30_01730 [Candidatus Saccharimonadales bacterium]
MGNLHEGTPQLLSGKEKAMIVVEKLREGQMLGGTVQTDESIVVDADSARVIGRQTPPGHWMDRQVEMLRRERLAAQGAEEAQGELHG